jgi:hypothetical protein
LTSTSTRDPGGDDGGVTSTSWTWPGCWVLWPWALRRLACKLRIMRTRTLLSLLAVTSAAVGYTRYLRPRQLTWGATPDEVSRVLPSDQLVARASFNATRAITIAALPADIWPWVVQMGLTRAGWYSYDILDNLGRPSARRIIPELQHLTAGDLVPMSPNGKQGMVVHSLHAPHQMVWGTPGDTTWAWQLDPTADGSTRLITRVRSRYRWTSPTIAFSALLEFGDIWMMRKMLLNLRDRVESAQDGTSGRRPCESHTAASASLDLPSMTEPAAVTGG